MELYKTYTDGVEIAVWNVERTKHKLTLQISIKALTSNYKYSNLNRRRTDFKTFES